MAAELGVPLPQFVADALVEKLRPTGPFSGRELAKYAGAKASQREMCG
jgi:hypothetical protein